MSIVKVPNLGDGINSATVLSILVKAGDTIQKDQTILELETDKATAPVPASEAGVIAAILVKEGDTVSTGSPVVQLVGAGQAAAPAAPTPTAAVAQLVSTATPAAVQATATTVQQPRQAATTYVSPNGLEPPASPSIKKLANDIGLDLRLVPGSETGGRVVLADIRNFIQTLISTSQTPAPAIAQAPNPSPTTPLPDFTKFGPTEHKPLTTLRKKISEKMSESWTNVPHVTQFEEIDITALMELRKKHNPSYKEKGANLTVTMFAVKAIINSLKEFPQFNSSYDTAKNELILKNYFNIGIAVDTENGLIVPVVKNADQKDMLKLCLEVNDLAEKARTRKIGMEDLQGGSFTITNLGSLGVAQFTPIVNVPEVAILALSAGKLKPVVVNNKIETRLIMPISLSYDHRVIDGADGARFIKHFCKQLEEINATDLGLN